jgi:predicted dinucleotide-binding enzyme
MNYAIIGSGKIGSALARHFAGNGIPVALANTRGPDSLTALVRELGNAVVPKDLPGALEADCVVLAVPFGALRSVATALPDWKGKIVIDAMNAFGVPLAELGNSPSSARVARALPGAKVVKAFNHLPAAILAAEPTDKGGRRVVFVSGDDPDATATVLSLAEQLGFAPIDLGKIGEGGALIDVRGSRLGSLLLQDLVRIEGESV